MALFSQLEFKVFFLVTCFLGEVVLLFGLVGAVSGLSCYMPFLLFKLERFLVDFEQIFPLIWFILASLVHPISGANLFFKLLVIVSWPMTRV